MSSTQKPADVTAERRSHWWWTVPGCLAMVLLNAAVSYGIVRLNAPVTVAFNMKQTVDAFFDSASQKQLSEVQSKVVEIIVDKLGVKESEVTPEASFTNHLGADSLDTVELIMEFEKAFDIQIPDEDAEKIATVGDAISYIEAHKK